MLTFAVDLVQVGVALLQSTIPESTLLSPTAASTPNRSIGNRSTFLVTTPKAGICCEYKEHQPII